MKKLLFISAIVCFAAFACSSGGNQSEPVTEQEEAEIVKSLNEDLNAAQEALKEETEESLNEIDSLLQDF